MEQRISQQKIQKRPLILASVMLGMFLAAIEATIVATAMPSIVAEFGGFSLYSWIFSAYLLTNAATVLIFGKLADIYGRKPIFTIGVILFLTGSSVGGFSLSMEMLIVARFIQGIGAGALMPIALTIVGDIYNKEQRAKIQGYLSSVWGISAVIGPLVGGFFVDFLSWRFIFWMNIPIGLLAMLGILLFLHENVEKKKHAIDYEGAVWIVLAVSTLMVIFVEGGTGIPWKSFRMGMLVAVSITGFILFARQERQATDPMMPFFIWKYRVVSTANLTTLTTGMILLGVSSYLPAFVQGVMEESAIVAGFTLTTMSIGWPIASTIAGRLLLIIGYRNTSLIGAFSLIVGGIVFFLLSPDKGPVWAGAGSFFIGVGMGLTSTAFIVAIQNAVDWRTRGIATAANMFMRTVGSALGAALLGGILNGRMQIYIEQQNLEDRVSVDMANRLLDTDLNTTMPKAIKDLLKEGLTTGLHTVYTMLLILGVISLLFILFMPKKLKE